jgi:F-type H+-transporting ATPase subunit a
MEHGKIVSKEGLHFPDIIDLSITKNVFTLLLGALFMIVIFLYIASIYKKNKNKAPTGIQSFFEPIIEFIRDEVAKPSIGKH